jgi:hypothetical protein
MSRTIRRKNAGFLLGAWAWTFHGWSEEKGRALFHSNKMDNWWQGTPPHWYRRLYNKKHTMWDKQQLARWWKDPDHEVQSHPRPDEAAWYW